MQPIKDRIRENKNLTEEEKDKLYKYYMDILRGKK